jgi:ribosomal-protein-alanine N-acetyltransferase
MEFKLREWRESDLQSLVKYANNFAIAKNMTNKFPHPYNEDNGKNFIAFAKANSDRMFCIEINGEACGGAGLHTQEDIHCRNMELGYWLAEPFWGKGIVPGVVKQMIEIGFKNFDIDRIFARPFGHNLASQKVLEKSGFVLEGKFEKTLFKNGEYIDELIYAVRRKV